MFWPLVHSDYAVRQGPPNRTLVTNGVGWPKYCRWLECHAVPPYDTSGQWKPRPFCGTYLMSVRTETSCEKANKSLTVSSKSDVGFRPPSEGSVLPGVQLILVQGQPMEAVAPPGLAMAVTVSGQSAALDGVMAAGASSIAMTAPPLQSQERQNYDSLKER